MCWWHAGSAEMKRAHRIDDAALNTLRKTLCQGVRNTPVACRIPTMAVFSATSITAGLSVQLLATAAPVPTTI